LGRDYRTTREFDRAFKRLPRRIQSEVIEKLARFLEDPTHPSLRVKRLKGTQRIWEMSITMSYRVTFEIDNQSVLLRRIGTHDVLKRP
jgi:mRNA-degrading endonuclease RelE of RelBE toxin-antitoxin system